MEKSSDLFLKDLAFNMHKILTGVVMGWVGEKLIPSHTEEGGHT